MLEVIPAERRDIVVREVCDILQEVITHEEDGSQCVAQLHAVEGNCKEELDLTGR
jgi:hypothetical protein